MFVCFCADVAAVVLDGKTTDAVHSKGVSESVSAAEFEEVTVRGMSVSAEGFCVILQGAASDRCVRVLVTPEDPMSDGLDHDEVESSEAVTLLQLLQGIDVETHLAKDAFATKFGGIDPQSYELKMVKLDGVGRGKDFEASLVASVRRRTEAGTENPCNILQDSSESQPQAVLHAADIDADRFLLPDTVTAAGTTRMSRADGMVLRNEASASTGPDGEKGSASSGQGNTAVDNRVASDRTVSTDSAFYAIALALRHHVPIEVRTDLMQDEKKSFASTALASLYPKLLAAASTRETEVQVPKLPSVATAVQHLIAEAPLGTDATAGQQGQKRTSSTNPLLKTAAKSTSKQDAAARGQGAENKEVQVLDTSS
jgi:hypothetical protein